MATYTPAALVSAVALTSVTSTTQNYSAPTGTTGIARTFQFNAVGANAFTASIGQDAVGTRIFYNTALSANVPAIYNGWWVTAAANASAIQIYASTTSGTNVVGYVAGYTYA